METTIHIQKKTVSNRPILIGVLSMLGVMTIGVGMAAASGFLTPASAEAFVITPPCCTVPVPPPPPPPPPTPVFPVTPPCCTVPVVPVVPPPTVIPPVVLPVIVTPPTVVTPITPQCTLSASPTTLTAPGNTALTWTTQNAVSGTIDQGVGEVTPIAGGSRTVAVPATTHYTLTVTSATGQTANCDTTVTITTLSPLPVCTLTATPGAIQVGSSSTLAWTTQNATSFTIDHGVGSVTPLASGNKSVSPIVNTTYTGTVTGPGGTATCSAPITVTVLPPTEPECTLTASPAEITRGNSSTLTWTTVRGVSFVIDNGVGTSTPVAGGTTSVSPTATTVYTGTVTDTKGSTKTCTATVTVTTGGHTPMCTLTASASSINRGDSVTLTWGGSYLTNILINNDVLAATTTTSGSIAVSPTSDTTYTATATGDNGQTYTCEAPVKINTSGGGCTSNCGGGGGGGNPNPHVILSSNPGEQSLVYLSQLPYTGLDLGPWGTALYWLALILWSAALGYLVLFNVVPFAAARVRAFGTSVGEALNAAPVHYASASAPAPAMQHSAHEASHTVDVHSTGAHTVTVEQPVGYSASQGFRSFSNGPTLSIDDIVHGLARESAHEASHVNVTVDTHTPSTVSVHTQEPVALPSISHEDISAAVAAHAPRENVMSEISHDVHSFLSALLAGNRDEVFSTVRGVTRSGGDSELFLTQAVCALDDAYRARIDGTPVHPEIAKLTANCHPTFLERIVSSLTTAVDGSYSQGVTGVKLALTRALNVVNG